MGGGTGKMGNRHKPWSEHDIQALREGAGMVDWVHMAGELGRSERAVVEKARRLGLIRGDSPYAPGELAALLGVTTRTLASWRKAGLLRGYSRRHVRQFLWKHAEMLDRSKAKSQVDLVWLVGVLTGGGSGRKAA